MSQRQDTTETVMFRFYFKTIEIKAKYINGLSCILYLLTLDLTRVILTRCISSECVLSCILLTCCPVKVYDVLLRNSQIQSEP